ncbi:MAG: protein-tyrosine-phosphatase [Cyclobacteriaceae bacterium]
MKSLLTGLLLTTSLLYSCTGEEKPNTEKAVSAVNADNETMPMHPQLSSYIEMVSADMAALPEDRKALLQEAADYIRTKQKLGKAAGLVFICTHNSRRSHMSQLWAQTMAAYLGKPGLISSYSGGTEATAFNPRAVRAMEEAGFTVVNTDSNTAENPVYEVTYAPDGPQMLCYSKKYDAEENPQTGFAAIMTCSQADEACPVVRGAEVRIPVMYEDPKAYDGTAREAEAYRERCRQIATEMLYMMSKV